MYIFYNIKNRQVSGFPKDFLENFCMTLRETTYPPLPSSKSVRNCLKVG